MHDSRTSLAASAGPSRSDGSSDARGDGRRTRVRRAGTSGSRRTEARTPRPVGEREHGPEAGHDQPPVLPPPLGDAPAPSAGEPGDAHGSGHQAAGGTPSPMRVVEILSHELRSPITTIHLGTKVLREQGNRISRPTRLEVVEAVEEEAERLYRLVEDLLAVARHEGGAAPLPVGPIALQHWLAPVIAAEVQSSPSLKVRVSIPPDLPPVLADDAALVQVVRDLLANVTRYAADGMPAEVVAWPPEDGVVRLEVLDRGPGIAADEIGRVFEPFYRSSSAEAVGSGAGLGLAAARRLMEAMNGSIEALPRDGGGSRFVLTLPVAPADAEADEGAEPSSGADGPAGADVDPSPAPPRGRPARGRG